MASIATSTPTSVSGADTAASSHVDTSAGAPSALSTTGADSGQWRESDVRFGCVPEDKSDYQHQALVVKLDKLVHQARSTLRGGVSRHVLVAQQLSFKELDSIVSAVSSVFPGGSVNVAAVDDSFVLTASSIPTRASKRRARNEDDEDDEDRRWQEAIEDTTRQVVLSEKAKARLSAYVRATRSLRGAEGEEMHVRTVVRRDSFGDELHLVVATLLAGGVGVSVRSLAAATRSLDGLVSIRVGGQPANRNLDPAHAGLFAVSCARAVQHNLPELLLLTHWKA